MKMLVLGLTLVVCLSLVNSQGPPSTEKPLVRCRRPLCEVYCPVGTQVDERGCETCVCKEPETPLPSTPMPVMPCPEPMCANDCREFGGYKHNERGCMTCQCKERINCEDLECSVGQFCHLDQSHCVPGMEDMECLPRPICLDEDQKPATPPAGCPMRKCAAVRCQYGLRRDENNCPLCECSNDPCETHECHQGQACELDTLPGCEGITCPIIAKCTFKSLCNHHQHIQHIMNSGDRLPDDMPSLDLVGGPLGYMPRCEDDGTFHPQQCSMDRARPDCWCVDDMGKEIAGTHRPLMVADKPTPKCERNHTESMEMKFQIWHEFEDIEPHLDSLKQSVKQHLSHWLTVQEQFIMIVKIEPDGREQFVLIHVLIMQDGETDLPSAAFHMHDQMRKKHCNIHFKGQTMRSDADTLEVKPRYREPEVELPHDEYKEKEDEDGWQGFCKAHQTAVIVGCVGGTIILICLAVVIISASRKKSASHQFKHKKFDNYQKNLAMADNTMKHPDDLEKEPTVAVVSVTSTELDGSSIA